MIIHHKIQFNVHLYNPVFVDKKVRGLQIPMHYHWCAVVQIVHSSSLKSQNRFTSYYYSKSLVTEEASMIALKGNKIPTASRAILNRLRSSNWLLGRWSNLYKLPLQNMNIYISKYTVYSFSRTLKLHSLMLLIRKKFSLVLANINFQKNCNLQMKDCKLPRKKFSNNGKIWRSSYSSHE